MHAAWHAQNKKEYFSWEFVITKTATPSVIKIAYWRSCHVIAQNQNSCVIFLNEWLQNKNHRTDGLETATPVNMLLINQGTKLEIAKKRRDVKGKGEKERYTYLNAELQRIARRDEKAFLSE